MVPFVVLVPLWGPSCDYDQLLCSVKVEGLFFIIIIFEMVTILVFKELYGIKDLY